MSYTDGYQMALSTVRTILDDAAKAGEDAALTVERVRAIVGRATEPVGERSCFTCEHDRGRSCAGMTADNIDGVLGYISASGAEGSFGGMPTNRTIPCPGHAPKVTT